MPFSLLLHAGLVALALSTRLPSMQTTYPVPAPIVWLMERLPSEGSPTTEAAPVEPVRESSAPPTAESLQRSRADEPPNARHDVRAPAETVAAEAASAAPPIDWDARLREAYRQMREQRERESRYSTFSADDAVAPPPPARDPVPTGEIFSRNTPSRAVLAPSQQRTKIGRRLADFCHALTGGFGVSVGFQGFPGLRLFTMCASEDGRSDLFAAIRPDYLKRLPECTSDGSADVPPLLARCRLVAPSDLPRSEKPE